MPFLAASWEAHPSFGNVTIENNENTEKEKKDKLKLLYWIAMSFRLPIIGNLKLIAHSGYFAIEPGSESFYLSSSWHCKQLFICYNKLAKD